MIKKDDPKGIIQITDRKPRKTQ